MVAIEEKFHVLSWAPDSLVGIVYSLSGGVCRFRRWWRWLFGASVAGEQVIPVGKQLFWWLRC